MNLLYLIAPASAVIALIFAIMLVREILSQSTGTPLMTDLSQKIKKGASAYLKRQYLTLSIFVVIMGAVLFFFISKLTAMAFIIGAVSSACAGYGGMMIATSANVRTTQAARSNLHKALRVAFSSGSVMGLTVVGLGLLGVTCLYFFFNDVSMLFGFGFGASSVALFARVGGGIYTKSADVGADLVGKVEAGIPEDDPRNPAVIADNVGDNVGDVAGMGADLFESYVDSIIAAMALGVVGVTFGAINLTAGTAVLLPMLIAGIGIICSVAGSYLVLSMKKGDPHNVMNLGIFASSGLTAILSFIAIWYLTGSYHLFISLIAGLISGLGIGLATEYYTSDSKKPAQSIALSSKMGSATNIITGLSVGMFSTALPVLFVVAAILVSYGFGGVYGIAIAAVGMLSTLGITLASDTYGPVADNAAGIAEMAKVGPVVRKRTESLDAVGNTTAAIGKGFAIGSAALTALALFVTYSETVGLTTINLITPKVVVGLFLGALLPYLFSAFAMKAVGNAAMAIVEEVRRQFKTIKGLMKGKAEADYVRCIDISTNAALKEMIIPSLLAILSPIAVGLFLGVEALGGLLAGAVASGFLLAIMMANSGGAWDNAKKYIEAGHLGGKGSDAHKNAVVGDTVGDPFKDTAGPALNILIKLMSIIALVFIPLFL